MDDRLKESLSALVDDEANELEIQRVLSNLDDDAVDTWERYHGIRDAVNGYGRELPKIDIRQSLADELGYDLDSDDGDVDTVLEDQPSLVAGVSDMTTAVQSSVLASSPAQSPVVIKKKSFGGTAFGIAASAALALVLATQYQDTLTQETGGSSLVAASDPSSLESKDSVLVELPSETFLAGGTANVSSLTRDRQPKIIVQLSDEHAKQFNQYLLRHAEHSVYGFTQGVMPLARVASVNSVGL